MRKLRYFKCSNDHVIEELVEDDITSVNCECGETSKRLLSAPRCFGNTTGKSPSSSYTKPQ